MTRSEIINDITEDPQYLAYCKRVCNGADIHKDLYQYIVLYFLELDENRLIEIYNTGGLRNYIARVIYTQAYGKTSGFTREIKGTIVTEDLEWLKEMAESHDDFEFHESKMAKKYFEFVADNENRAESEEKLNEFDKEIQRECARCEAKGIYPTSVKLYQIYEEKQCYTEVSKCLGIPYRTVQYHIHGLRNKAVKAVNDKNTSSNNRTNNRA